MGKKNKNARWRAKENGGNTKEAKKKEYLLTLRTKRWIKAILMFVAAIIAVLSFLDKAGRAGQFFKWLSEFLVGKSILVFPLLLIISGIIFLKVRKKIRMPAVFLAVAVITVGIAGILGAKDLAEMNGGWVGFLLGKIIAGSFGVLVANIVFGAAILVGLFVFLQFIWDEIFLERKEDKPLLVQEKSSQDLSSLKIKGAEDPKAESKSPAPKMSLFGKSEDKAKEKKQAVAFSAGKLSASDYRLPPIDLLSKDDTAPTSGNIKENSLIIKKTFENFGIPVEMAEVNIGPTVTQYAFKPAEGVKLSKITTLTNNLALALAAHPIRIEAPIPGRSLVGIEVPNKIRATVTLRNLISDPTYQNSPDFLTVALGKDVSGSPVSADLAEMPHLLVAGATGTGKTIFLNSLILSLLYKNTPETMRMIMVDPKRVEFQHYNEIPHLLCPVIYDAPKTMNALQWLAKEMERRFEVFSEIPTRNIKTYNSNKSVIASESRLPYVVLIIDELADLMAAKGKELEAGIVRLAQMARATGIHLVLATQRPSVEVITGLIKANITSRITFQVASQVDSRTVLDTAGAEKLLGSGDMLFLSSKSAKIARIQGPYVAEKEVKKVVDWISGQAKSVQESQPAMTQGLKDVLEQSAAAENGGEVFWGEDDPLFEDVKRIVLETKKASASFLQRRLRIGYSRAARLIDMLEEKGIVGPADGAKPREVYNNPGTSSGSGASFADFVPEQNTEPGADKGSDSDDWQKV